MKSFIFILLFTSVVGLVSCEKDSSPGPATEVYVNGTVYHPTVTIQIAKLYEINPPQKDSLFKGLRIDFSFYIADSFYSCILFQEYAKEIKTNVYDSGAFYISASTMQTKESNFGYVTNNIGVINFYDKQSKRITLSHKAEFFDQNTNKKISLSVKLNGHVAKEIIDVYPARGPF
ncbi:MAG: hypothetical protein V4658_15540 [Bacteroidota bacterium]